MRRSGLILVLISFSLFLNAQIPKGTKMIGTRLNYNQYKSDNSTVGNAGTTTNVNTNKGFSGLVNGGYFIKDNLVVGLVVGYGNQFSEYSNTTPGMNSTSNSNSSSSTTFSVGLYGRIYKMMKDNKIGFFGNMDVLYSSGKSNTEYVYSNNLYVNTQTSKGDITGYSLSLSPGVVYFITDRIGLEASYGNLSFRNQTTESTYNDGRTGTDIVNGINFNFSVSSLNVGVNFYFSDKK